MMETSNLSKCGHCSEYAKQIYSIKRSYKIQYDALNNDNNILKFQLEKLINNNDLANYLTEIDDLKRQIDLLLKTNENYVREIRHLYISRNEARLVCSSCSKPLKELHDKLLQSNILGDDLVDGVVPAISHSTETIYKKYLKLESTLERERKLSQTVNDSYINLIPVVASLTDENDKLKAQITILKTSLAGMKKAKEESKNMSTKTDGDPVNQNKKQRIKLDRKMKPTKVSFSKDNDETITRCKTILNRIPDLPIEKFEFIHVNDLESTAHNVEEMLQQHKEISNDIINWDAKSIAIKETKTINKEKRRNDVMKLSDSSDYEDESFTEKKVERDFSHCKIVFEEVTENDLKNVTSPINIDETEDSTFRITRKKYGKSTKEGMDETLKAKDGILNYEEQQNKERKGNNALSSSKSQIGKPRRGVKRMNGNDVAEKNVVEKSSLKLPMEASLELDEEMLQQHREISNDFINLESTSIAIKETKTINKENRRNDVRKLSDSSDYDEESFTEKKVLSFEKEVELDFSHCKIDFEEFNENDLDIGETEDATRKKYEKSTKEERDESSKAKDVTPKDKILKFEEHQNKERNGKNSLSSSKGPNGKPHRGVKRMNRNNVAEQNIVEKKWTMEPCLELDEVALGDIDWSMSHMVEIDPPITMDFNWSTALSNENISKNMVQKNSDHKSMEDIKLFLKNSTKVSNDSIQKYDKFCSFFNSQTLIPDILNIKFTEPKNIIIVKQSCLLKALFPAKKSNKKHKHKATRQMGAVIKNILIKKSSAQTEFMTFFSKLPRSDKFFDEFFVSLMRSVKINFALVKAKDVLEMVDYLVVKVMRQCCEQSRGMDIVQSRTIESLLSPHLIAQSDVDCFRLKLAIVLTICRALNERQRLMAFVIDLLLFTNIPACFIVAAIDCGFIDYYDPFLGNVEYNRFLTFLRLLFQSEYRIREENALSLNISELGLPFWLDGFASFQDKDICRLCREWLINNPQHCHFVNSLFSIVKRRCVK